MNLIVKNSTASGQQTKKVRLGTIFYFKKKYRIMYNALASFDVVSLDLLLNVIFPWRIIVLPFPTLFESWVHLGRVSIYAILIKIFTTTLFIQTYERVDCQFHLPYPHKSNGTRVLFTSHWHQIAC